MYETFIVRPKSKRAYIITNFGWKFKKHYNKGDTQFDEYERDKSMPYYEDFRNLENRYYKLEKSLQNEVSFSPIIFILLFILFIVPSFVYYFNYLRKKKKEEELNNDKKLQMASIINDCKALNIKLKEVSHND